jgi:hypothetical protein
MTIRVSILLFASLAATSAHAQKVSLQFDPAAKFANYHTFVISHNLFSSKNSQLNLELIQKRIEFDIEHDLTARGLEMVAGSGTADLVVGYQFVTRGMQRTTTAQYVNRVKLVSKEPFAEGTITIDLRDDATHSLVWQAVATVDKGNAEKVEGKIDDMIAKVLKKYPPNAKSGAASAPAAAR